MSGGRARRVLLVGEMGVANHGNEASLAATLELLAQDPGLEPVVMGYVPREIEAVHGVEATRLTHPDAPRGGLWRPVGKLADGWWILRQVGTVDAVVVTGTGIFEGAGVKPHGIPLSLFWVALAARLRRRPFLVLSVGLDDVGDRVTRWLFARTLESADLLSVRDDGSAAAARAIGVRVRPRIVPDLVLARRSDLPGPAPLVAGEPPTVAVGVMDWGGTEREDERRAYVRRGVDLVRAVLALGTRVRVVGGAGLDMDVVHRVVRGVLDEEPDAPVDAVGSTDVESLSAALRGCRLVVATRYHNLVAALSEGIPVVALAYGPKHRWLLEHFGFPERAHDRDTYDLDVVVDQVRDALTTVPEDAAAVARVLRTDRAAVEAQAREVLDLLGGPERPARVPAAPTRTAR